MKEVTYQVTVSLKELPSRTEEAVLERHLFQSKGMKRLILDGLDAQLSISMELRETNYDNYIKVNVVKTK